MEVSQHDGSRLCGMYRQVLTHRSTIEPLHTGSNGPHTNIITHQAMYRIVFLEGSEIVLGIDGTISQLVGSISHLGATALSTNSHLCRCGQRTLCLLVDVCIIKQGG